MNLPSSRRAVRLPALTALSSVALLLAISAPASAAELALKCAGPGPRSSDSSGEIHCAANPGKARAIAGTVRNDAGQPVAAKVTVTRSTWVVAPGGGYHVKPTNTTEIAAKADGTFTFATSPKGRETLRFDVAADPALGIAAGASAEAEVARRLVIKVAKLGGGLVRFTVAGTKLRPIKITITDTSGYAVSGLRPKKINRAGKATFNLGSRMGRFSYYLDAGAYQDLFWYETVVRKTFKL